MPLWAKLRASRPPESLLRAIVNSLGDRYYGLEALAIASLRERGDHMTWIEALPDIPGFATTPEQKLATARSWMRCWGRAGLWMSQMPPAWRNSGRQFQARSGKFDEMNRLIADGPARTFFNKEWLPKLLQRFGEQVAPNKFYLKGSDLSLHRRSLGVLSVVQDGSAPVPRPHDLRQLWAARCDGDRPEH
jgi:hypothetical protein